MNKNTLFGRVLVAMIFGAFGISCANLQSKEDRGEIELGGSSLKPTGQVEHGKASWYSIRTNGGTVTASGERLRNDAATAAHRTLPMGTMVKVTNLRNGRSEVVRITDRGPFIKGRIIDVTIGTAEKLGMVNAGVVPCKVERLTKVR